VAASPAVLGAAAGGVAAQLALAFSPAPDARWVASVALRVALGLWAAWTLLGVVAAVAERRAIAGAPPAPAGHRWQDWQIVLGGAALLAAGTLRAPGRLVMNLLGYGLVALALVWVVRRSGGPAAAARAATVLAVCALLPLTADWRGVPELEPARADSAYRWPVGWPAPGWVLRQEILLPAGSPPPRRVEFQLLHAYDGPARVLATVNGEDAGPLVADGTVLSLRLPEHLVTVPGRLTVELRQAPPDPELQLLAQRWTAGATLGARASSHFDGERWWPGTFVEATGRRQPGVYVLQLRDES
jgi:hypothetical protein